MAAAMAELVWRTASACSLSRRCENRSAISSVNSRGSSFDNFRASCSHRLSWGSGRNSSSVRPGTCPIKVAAAVNGEAGGEQQGLLTKDELLMLRKKAADLSSHLQGSSIFLVGMSKSGKTTVGKCLSEVLGYYFFDCQQLVLQAAGEQLSEMVDEELEHAETEVLMQLSPLVRLIVATGERAVLRTRNWGYLRTGVTVWLDWPVDALVQRKGDLDSAPEEILHITRKGLQERAEFYANADAIVSIQKIAALKDTEDLNSITPPVIAYHVLDEIYNVLEKSQKSRK